MPCKDIFLNMKKSIYFNLKQIFYLSSAEQAKKIAPSAPVAKEDTGVAELNTT